MKGSIIDRNGKFLLTNCNYMIEMKTSTFLNFFLENLKSVFR